MATDNTDVFAADANDTRPTREELEKQLAELDDPATAPERADEIIDAADVDDDDDAAEPEWLTYHSDFLDRDVRIAAPTDVAVTMFQQDMASRVAQDSEKVVLMGDFARRFVHPADFADWRNRIQAEAEKNPRHAFGVFWRENEKMVEELINVSTTTDSDYLEEEQNRAERRAALKRKQARLKAGQDRR